MKLPSAPLDSQWKSQCFPGDERQAPATAVPKKSISRRPVTTSAMDASVPSRAHESGGGDECRTPPEKWMRRESNPSSVSPNSCCESDLGEADCSVGVRWGVSERQ